MMKTIICLLTGGTVAALVTGCGAADVEGDDVVSSEAALNASDRTFFCYDDAWPYLRIVRDIQVADINASETFDASTRPPYPIDPKGKRYTRFHWDAVTKAASIADEKGNSHPCFRDKPTNFYCHASKTPWNDDLDPSNGSPRDYFRIPDINTSERFSTDTVFIKGLYVPQVFDANKKPFVFSWDASKQKASLVDARGNNKYICSRVYETPYAGGTGYERSSGCGSYCGEH